MRAFSLRCPHTLTALHAVPSQVDMLAVESIHDGDTLDDSSARAAQALLCGTRRLLALLLQGPAGRGVAHSLPGVGGGALPQWLHRSGSFVGCVCSATGVIHISPENR